MMEIFKNKKYVKYKFLARNILNLCQFILKLQVCKFLNKIALECMKYFRVMMNKPRGK